MFKTDAPVQKATEAALADPPRHGFAALDHALRRSPGHKLFTVLTIDWARKEHRRVYSSDPAAYPCGGAKPLLEDSAFFRQLIATGESRICRNRDECRAAFFDHALIEQLGCASAINVPIRSDGVTLGSLNLLHQAGWYTPDMVPALERCAEIAASLLRAPTFPPLP